MIPEAPGSLAERRRHDDPAHERAGSCEAPGLKLARQLTHDVEPTGPGCLRERICKRRLHSAATKGARRFCKGADTGETGLVVVEIVAFATRCAPSNAATGFEIRCACKLEDPAAGGYFA